jgi:hypothetical protein
LGKVSAMTANPAELTVEVQAGPDNDAAELTQLTDRLRAELLDLDVDAVRRLAVREVPEDSKGTGWLAAGQLMVGLVATPEVLAAIISTVQSWLSRNRVRSVKLTLGQDALEVSGVSSVEQERLIDLWIARHGTDT